MRDHRGQMVGQIGIAVGGLAGLRHAVEARLEAILVGSSDQPELVDAMRYTVLAPAKRVRPLLAITATLRHGGGLEHVLDAACAIELVHTSSLIFDDLPCMDDASLRRGRQTAHRRFGEGTAVLSAIALLTTAFELVARTRGVPDTVKNGCVALLAGAVGPRGLVAGQYSDLLASRPDLGEVEACHAKKTGALFAAAAEIGARIAGTAPTARDTLRAVGEKLGQAFQARDDVVDATSTVEQAGKDGGVDRSAATLVGIAGTEGALGRALGLVHEALDLLALDPVVDDPLQDLIEQAFEVEATQRRRSARHGADPRARVHLAPHAMTGKGR